MCSKRINKESRWQSNRPSGGGKQLLAEKQVIFLSLNTPLEVLISIMFSVSVEQSCD